MQKPQTTVFAPLDEHCQRVTQGVITVGGIATLPALFLSLSGRFESDIGLYGAVLSAVVAGVFLVGIGVAYAAMPVSLELGADALVVRRRWFRPIVVPYTHIEAVTTMPVGNDWHSEGWALSAGLFGYQGRYRSTRTGRCMAIATDRDRMVAIARRDAPMLVVSPLLPHACVNALREQLAKKDS
ncbi:MAG: hypothetical protein RLZZ297_1834 [Chloroflexota bacterium]